ncbi:MAG: chorismate mutase [Hyphomonadaceae bacterium]|nr:chorismate mutase [Hyphomonadaceae bacterium]
MNDGATDALETIRREIDEIDDGLLRLFAQRLQRADQLAALKRSAAAPLRPGREVTLLRRLVAAAPGGLDAELIVELWRPIIAATLRRQREIEVVVGGGRGDLTRLFDLARRHFGGRTKIRDVGEPQTALQRVSENPERVVAVTSWPSAPGVGAWWPALSERRFASVRLVAALPQFGAEDPEAALFGALDNEEAGGDISLVLAFDPHHRVQRALAEQGLSGREVARAEPRVLLRIEGFLSADDPRATALTRAGLDSVRVLGSYARI